MRKATVGTDVKLKWQDARLMTDLDFADDISLLADTNPALQQLTNAVSNEAKKIGLVVSAEKSKVMHVDKQQQTQPTVTLYNDKVLDNVDSFTYLGSVITDNGDMAKDMMTRLAKASSTFSSLLNIWRNTKLTLSTKLKVYNAIIIPTAIYASETWPLTKTLEKRLDAFDSKCLRQILKIRWQDHVTNVRVRQLTKQPYLSNIIRKKRLQWLGHVMRSDENRLVNKVLEWLPDKAKREPGRPRTTWKSVCIKDLTEINCSWEHASNAALDRNLWKSLCASCVDSHEKT